MINRVPKGKEDSVMRLRIIEPIEPKEKRRIRTCAYARVSTESLKQGESLENQIITYEGLIKSNPEYEFIKVYADQGITGYSENRPAFQEMIRDAREGKFDLIITKSISRFARNTVTVLKVARELKNLGVGIFFEEQNMNTLSGDGELMLAVLASFAQEESRSMSQNNKWSIGKKFERGEIMITTERFLGYDKDETGDLVINHEEAKTIREIYRLYLEGMGTFRIAKKLNEEGYKTVTGVKFTEGTVGGILKNEKYKGDYLLQKYYTPENKRNQTVLNKGEVKSYYISENHPAIISPDDWKKAQEIREKRKRVKNIDGEDGKYQRRYELSGMLICPHCSRTLRRRQVHNKRIQWICSTYIKEGKSACKGIRIDDTEACKQEIKEPTVVEEVIKNGKKHYLYTCQREFNNQRGAEESKEKENGSLLQSVNRPRRTAIKL